MEEDELLKFLFFDENNIFLFNFLTGKIRLFYEYQNSNYFNNKEIHKLL